jgi:predicted secreted Zn-dependent protease
MRQRLYKLTAVAMLGATTSCSNTSTPPDANSVFAPFPNTTINYYRITGTDVQSIRAQMNLNGPRDSADGKQVDALSKWHIDWKWPPDGQGKCDLLRLTTEFRATILLPRLMNTEHIKPDILKLWNGYLEKLMQHEANHIQYAHEHMADVEKDIKASTCNFANAAGYAALDKINQFDKDYDIKTRHGKIEGAHFP